MRKVVSASLAIASMAALSFLTSCGEKATPKVTGGPPEIAHSDDDGHGHAGHDHADHDHSGHDHASHDHADHDHPEEGPHHGHLIELGKDDYHAELTHDETTHTVTIYLLDSAAKKSVPIEEPEVTVSLVIKGKPVQYSLLALPLESDPEGKYSRFQLKDEQLCDGVCDEHAKGRLSVTIAGKPYVGAIEPHAHDGHDHH